MSAESDGVLIRPRLSAVSEPKYEIAVGVLADRGDGGVGVAAVILEVRNKLAVCIEGQRISLRLHRRRQETQHAHHHLARGRVRRKAIGNRRARRVDRDPEAVLAVEGDVVGEPGQVVRENVRSPRFLAFQPIA